MILLIAFAFLAGVVTILSPCIFPILPIILTSTIGGEDRGKSRPMGVVAGFIVSFTFFTLFLSTIVRISGISADLLRGFSIVIIAGFGASLLIPQFQIFFERLFSRLAGFMPQGQKRTGLGGGLLIGFSLGLLWTPCVGPILASVISLAITGTVTFDAFLITLAYSLGTAIPMFLIMLGGQNALRKVPWLLANTGKIQKAFGVLMMATAIGIFFNVDRRFQTYFLTTFPKYGVGLTKFEDNEAVKKQLQDMNQAPELIPGGVWFNSKPLQLSDLKGKVVLIDFWTYSCINCQRTLPYMRAWYEKYKDKGLVIIGVHSPEFEFEKNPDNVARAIKDFGLTYPVVQDNDFATWRAYDNHYWPAKYIVDREGFIRYSHFGEGAYDETERVIQSLLGITAGINNPQYQQYAKTPETYVGSSRNPFKIGFTLFGDWQISGEYARAPNGGILQMDFDAKNVYLVMRPSGKPAVVTVFVDDKRQKDVIVNADTLYALVSLDVPGRHVLRLVFDEHMPLLFAFTFG